LNTSDGYRAWYAQNTTVNITGCNISSNVASADVGGGILFGSGGTMYIRSSSITRNDAGRTGGGLHMDDGNSGLVIEESTVRGNTCKDGTGAQMYLDSKGPFTLGAGAKIFIGDDVPFGDADLTEIDGPAVGKFILSNESAILCNGGKKLVNRSSFGFLDEDPCWALKNDSCPCFFNSNGGIVFYPPARTTSLHYSCNMCQEGTYNFGGGYSIGFEIEQPECFPCAYGSSCPGGDRVIVQKGFWPLVVDRPGALDDIVTMQNCAKGYCCENSTGCEMADGCDDGTCDDYNPSAADSCFSDRTGTLCGACLPGFSQAFGATDCLPSSECSSGRWFFPSLAVLSFLYAKFLLQSQPASGHGWQNAITPVLYFYQQLGLVNLGGSVKTAAIEAIAGLLSMEVNVGGSSGICAIAGWTTLDDLKFAFVPPFAIAFMLGFIFMINLASRVRAFSLRAGGTGTEIDARMALEAALCPEASDSFTSSNPLSNSGPLASGGGLHADAQQPLTSQLVSNDRGMRLTFTNTPAPRKRWDTKVHVCALPFCTRLHLTHERARALQYRLAFPKLVLLSYAKLMTASLAMVNCVSLGDLGDRMLLTGEHSCGWWQAPFYIGIVLLTIPVFGVVIYVVHLGSTRPAASDSLLSLVVGCLSRPYRDDR
jgi:hypothetical protein